MQLIASGIVFAVILVFVIAVLRRRRRGRGGLSVGSGAAGAVYDLLNNDKRNALELIVDERTGYRDPEDKDGDLPKLAGRS